MIPILKYLLDQTLKKLLLKFFNKISINVLNSSSFKNRSLIVLSANSQNFAIIAFQEPRNTNFHDFEERVPSSFLC